MDLLDASDATLYDALIARDPGYDGRADVGVTTTGVFCRLTCPARKPLRDNCRFFRTVAGCVAAGFRPCLRCHPLATATASAADPVVAPVMAAWGADRARRWTEADVAALGFDASTARRAFRSQFGMTLARSRGGSGTPCATFRSAARAAMPRSPPRSAHYPQYAQSRANGENSLALVIPCHRVLGADGALTGYGGGLWRKRWLIDLERRIAATEEAP
jgi:O-6-methylguanine DNA methyltransferase